MSAPRSTHNGGHIPPEVAEQLGYYVYILRDPRDSSVFYVGKGTDNRIHAHVAVAHSEQAVETAKINRIRAIEADGETVEHLFIRTGLVDEQQAFAIEQAVIDAYTAAGIALTNLVAGHHSDQYGLATADAAIARYQAPPAPACDEPIVIFLINRAWHPAMSPDEIYEATRGHWVISAANRDRARYAFGVAGGVVRGVFAIDRGSWFPSEMPEDEGQNRWGFTGTSAAGMAHYIGTSIRHLVPESGAQNPVRTKYLTGLPAPTGDNRAPALEHRDDAVQSPRNAPHPD